MQHTLELWVGLKESNKVEVVRFSAGSIVVRSPVFAGSVGQQDNTDEIAQRLGWQYRVVKKTEVKPPIQS